MNKFFRVVATCALGLAMSFAPREQAHAQDYSAQTNIVYPIVTLTATSQTSTPIVLGKNPSGTGGSYSVGNVSVSGTSLTTATFAVYGSSDGGNTYYPLNVNSVTTPSTVATTTTVTGPGLYQVNLAGITQVEFVTSGTFTATNLTLTLTVSPNGIIARTTGGGGGGSGTVTNFAISPSSTFLNPLFTCSVANSTTTPTLTCSQPTTAANTVFAGPATGSAAAPTFRALVTADLPTGTGTVTSFSSGNLSPLFTTSVATQTTTPAQTFGLSNAGQNLVFAGPATGGTGAPSYRALVAADLPAGTTPVTSVFTRTGAVVAASGDYTCAQTTNCPTTSSAVQTLIGSGVYLPVGDYYAGTATGAVNVLAATLNSGLGSPTQASLTGIIIGFTPNLANTTTTPTLNINGLGAVTIVKGTSTALVAGDIALNTPALVVYNGTNYQLINPQVGITQSQTSSSTFFSNSMQISGGGAYETTSGGNATNFVGGQNLNSASVLGAAIVHGGNNSSTNSAAGGGASILEGGSAPSTGTQGFANVQQSFTTASALAATFEAVSMTTTSDLVQASPTASVTNVGIAQTAGGTNAQVYVVSNGKTTARFDGTPVVGDVACYPLSGGTAGLLHDNGTTACTLGESAGVITGQVSGTGSGSTATVEIR